MNSAARRMPRSGPVIDALARGGGAALRAVFGAILLVRRPRPIHAHGAILAGEISWLGNPVRSGIAWIDDPPPEPARVVARVSRSVGLPAFLPDIYGLALRLEIDGRAADIELASTGFGVPLRFSLLLHRSPSKARLGTLLPYRGDDGPRLLCARTIAPSNLPAGTDEVHAALSREPWRLRLYFASPAGKWHPFADVVLRAANRADGDDLRFDAVRHPLPGAGTYRWVDALRQPSYDAARAASPRED